MNPNMACNYDEDCRSELINGKIAGVQITNNGGSVKS